MATVLKGIKKGRRGNLSASGQDIVYTETLIYVVIADSPTVTLLEVLTTPGLPTVQVSSLPGTSGQCVCTKLDPKQDEGQPTVFFVEAEFSTKSEKQDTSSGSNPTEWVPIYSGKVEHYPEVMYEDLTPSTMTTAPFTNPGPYKYLNTAGDKFPEPLIYKRPVLVYDFFQYELPSTTDVQIGDRNDVVNKTAFRDFAAETLKLSVSGFERGFFFGINCVRVNYSVAYKKNKWLNRPLNVGWAYRDAGGKRHPSDTLVNLDASGQAMADNTTPLVLEFRECRQVEFDDFLR